VKIKSGLSGWCPGKSISALYRDVFSFDYKHDDRRVHFDYSVHTVQGPNTNSSTVVHYISEVGWTTCLYYFWQEVRRSKPSSVV
jgi:hypothetical protein